MIKTLTIVCQISAFFAVSALPDCSGNACPQLCECAEAKCEGEFSDCLADTDCANNKKCADQCKCGDMACLMKCAAEHPSAKAMTLLGCAKKQCLGKQLFKRNF